jgi:hypothetical protein
LTNGNPDGGTLATEEKEAPPKEHNDAQQNSKQRKLPDTESLCMR